MGDWLLDSHPSRSFKGFRSRWADSSNTESILSPSSRVCIHSASDMWFRNVLILTLLLTFHLSAPMPNTMLLDYPRVRCDKEDMTNFCYRRCLNCIGWLQGDAFTAEMYTCMVRKKCIDLGKVGWIIYRPENAEY
uniref:Defensin-like protein n=1 Tax=Steinernema glaseri TaxID=37863 RepID=A0A1I7ZWQ6_9BILA